MNRTALRAPLRAAACQGRRLLPVVSVLLATLAGGRMVDAATTSGAAAVSPPPPPLAAAAAGEPWDGRFFTSPPAELAAAAQSPADGKPVAFLFYEVRLSFDDGGRMSRTVRRVYRIATASADASWSEVSDSWLPWHQSRPRMRARVVTADGQEHRFDPQLITEASADEGDAEMFEDRRVLRGPLPAVAPGAVIEEEETVSDTAPLFDRGVVTREQLGGMGLAVAHVRAVVEAPAGLPLRYALHRLPATAPRREDAGGRQRLIFDFRDVPAGGALPAGLPPEVAQVPEIAVATAASWQDVAESYSRIVDRAIAGADLDAWMRTAPGGGTTPEAGSQSEAIERLTARLADVRYTGVELGEGGIVPRRRTKRCAAASATARTRRCCWSPRCGRSTSRPTWRCSTPATGRWTPIRRCRASAASITPSSSCRAHRRCGSIPPTASPAPATCRRAIRGALALIAAPGVTSLLRTPAAAAAANRVVKTREFFLADAGPARVVESFEYSGAAERSVRELFATASAENVRKMNDEHAQKVFSAQAAGAFEHSDPHDLSRPFKTRLEMAAASRGWTADADAGVAIFYSALFRRSARRSDGGGRRRRQRQRRRAHRGAAPGAGASRRLLLRSPLHRRGALPHRAARRLRGGRPAAVAAAQAGHRLLERALRHA
jgi:hypothetical protein